jgi:23S rRNA pseudouridine2605 synthase
MTRSRKPHRETDRGEAKIESADRLQKVLAAAGLGSRRDCEELITEGRVEVDRQVVTELGTKVDPLQHEIRVDGVVLHQPKRLYFALNKPVGVVTTNFDPSGRTRVIDLVPTEERVFPIGRLDRASEGLILVTNDGELANRVTHPRYGLEKTYYVRVEGSPSNEELLRLRRGVYIAEGMARVASVKVKSRHKHVTDLEIVLNEGKNREIRRILAKIGHKVLTLKRLAVGPVKLGELREGACRRLMPQEIESLLEATRQRRKEGKRKAGGERPDTTGEKPRGMKPVGGRREAASAQTRPAPAPIAGSAPPKIDLATLLNPSLAPKRAMPVSPAPPLAAGPAIGDVISYDATDEGSLAPAPTREKKRRRPMREYEADSEPIELLDQVPEREPREERPLRGAGNARGTGGQRGVGKQRRVGKAQRGEQSRGEERPFGRKPGKRAAAPGKKQVPRGVRADARRVEGKRPAKKKTFRKRRGK